MKKHITYMILCMLSAACSRTATTPEYGMVSIAFTPGILHTKTYDPEENKISDLNVFIFDENGILEESRYLQRSGLQSDGNTVFCNMRCIRNTELQVFACANVGFRINDINDIDDLNKFRYYMSYPDEYSRGIPMSGSSGKVKVNNDKKSIVVKMERLMSRISVSVDRRALKKNVRFNVRSIRIGGCPKSANMFARSKAEGKGDTFGQGFMKRYAETDDLNIDGNYIEGKVGDKVHLWAETDPAGSRLTFGKEELEYDKSRGLYDYTMDRDGHGVTLHLKNKGSGIVYIEAGAPVSDAAMAVIVIN